MKRWLDVLLTTAAPWACLAVLLGSCLPEGAVDADGDGFSREGGDCDDGDAALNPEGEERCGNGLDEDCDGAADEGFDQDGDGFLTCQTSTTAADCDDTRAEVRPNGSEVCDDGLDNDCEGTVDAITDAYEPNNSQATAAHLGIVDGDILTVHPTVYLESGPDVRDYFSLQVVEDDVEENSFRLVVRVRDIPAGLDLDLEVEGPGGARGSSALPGDSDEEVEIEGARGDDSGGWIIAVTLRSKGTEPALSCLPYTLYIEEDG